MLLLLFLLLLLLFCRHMITLASQRTGQVKATVTCWHNRQR
jgi:hypothetical protein